MADSSTEFTWKRVVTVKAEEPVARRYHSGVMYGGELFVFGGTGGGKEARNDLYSLRIESGSCLPPGNFVKGIPTHHSRHLRS